MILRKLSILNYKNIGEAQLLDAVYYLSFCRSASNPIDSQVIRHDQPFCMIEGEYDEDVVSVGMKRGQKKHFKRNKKEYKRLSEHIGLIPLVVVSPADSLLIEGGSEERRKLMDMVIAQYDRSYIDALSRYNNALQQRNILLKMEDPAPDPLVLQLWEEQMRDRHKDLAVGYSLHGVHRDDLEFTLDGHLMKREGSQGQNKTYVTSLKLAQFDFLKRTGSKTTPLLLLDDIFDKLDANRVEKIVSLVSSDNFGQIFITDTNRDHLDQILSNTALDYKIFHVTNGEIEL